MDAERLLDGLNEPQIEAVTATGGPVVVLAGAGSGKTRVLTRRIAWRILQGETDPRRVLTLTFTRKAAAELRDRQTKLGLRDGVLAGTFHGVALTQLRQRWSERRKVPPTLITSKGRLVGQLIGGGGNRRRAGAELGDIVAEIDWARARLVEPDAYERAARLTGRTPPIPAGDIAELMVRYQQEKRKKRVVDFDDLLSLATRDLRADQDYREAVRWRHRHFYVDEFQDVNPLQFALLQEWLGERHDLFLVGDPNQAIYGWNGADPSLLVGLSQQPESTVVELHDNYRSSPQVLAVAGTTLTRAAAAKLTAHGGDGPCPTVQSFPTDQTEASGIADAAKAAHSVGDRWSDQAVLVRTNAQLILIEQALSDLHIPARVRGGPGPLGSPEVKGELRAIGRDGIDLFQQLEHLDERLSAPLGPQSGLTAERRDNLNALSRLIHEYLVVDPRPTGPGLMAWIDTIQRSDVDSQADAVELVTFHGAKGLEWPVVHIAGLEDGFVPIAYAETAAQQAEERRLLYVALTRAERELHLTWAEERTFGAKTTSRTPSPMLDAITRTIADLDRNAPAAINWRVRIDRTRGRIAEPAAAGPPDETATLDALRTWRTRKARAGGVPPHVIVPDQLLQAVAGQRPITTAQLAALPGMRPTKLHRYGDEILAVLRTSDNT